MISPPEKKKQLLKADQLLIRRMKPTDVPQVMEIESVSFGRHHWTDESFHNEIQNHVGRYYSLINQDTDKLVGYLGLWLIIDEAHVTTVAVHPEYRGCSLGEVLLVHGLDRSMSQTIHWMTLEVRVSNNSAQNLYYKYGFSSVGVRPRYYQDNNEDALIMTTPDILSAPFRQLYNRNVTALKNKLGGLPAGFGK